MAEWRPPDGGYGWIVTLSSFFIMLIFSHPFVTIGLYLPDLLEYHQTSISMLSWVGALLVASGNIVATLVGIAIDIYGCQRVAIFGGISSVLCALCSSVFRYIFVLFICYGFVFSAVLNMLMSPVNISLLNYFTTKKTLVCGLVMSARSLGSLIWGPVTQWLIDEYRWHGAMLIFSALYLNTIPLAWLLKDTPIQKRKQSEIAKLNTLALLKRAVRYREVCSVTFALFVISCPFSVFGTMIPYVFLPTHLRTLGYSKQLGATMISVLGITGLISRPILGYIADRACVSRTVLLSITTLLSAVALILMKYTEQYYVFCILAAVCSMGHSAYSSVSPAALVDIGGLPNIAHSMGLFLMSSGIGLLSSVALSGKLVDITNNIPIVFLVSGLVQTVGAVIIASTYVSQRFDKTRRSQCQRNEKNMT